MFTITKNLKVSLPEGYKRQKLPFFRKWIEALESGEFKKITEQLANKQHTRFCCLGVLSKIQGRLGTQEEYNETGLDDGNPCSGVLGNEGWFPEDVEVIYKGHLKINLVALNDAGASFKTIAKLIKILWKA